MKNKFFFVVAIFLLLSFQANSQVGGYLGYNFAKIDGSETPVTGLSEKYLSNLCGGLFLDKDIIPLLDLRIGLMYSPKGTHYKSDDFYAKVRLNYLELPIQAKLKLGPVYALGGVYGAMAFDGKEKSELEIGGVTFKTDEDLDFDASELKKLDYGLKFGVGVQFGVGPIHIFAQGDYSFGLMNISDAQGEDLKNRVIGVSAGVIIGLQ